MWSWVAIGILCLLAASVIVSSKRCQAFLGMAAVVAVIALPATLWLWRSSSFQVSTAATTDQPRPRLTWQLFVPRADLKKTAEAKAERLYAQLRESTVESSEDAVAAESEPGEDLAEATAESSQTGPAGGTSGTAVAPRREWVRLLPTGESSDDTLNLKVRIGAKIEDYLAWYRSQSSDPGIEKLQAENLNWYLLKAVPLGRDKLGVMHVSLLFDDTFHNHVRERGRQMVMKDRLVQAFFISLATLGILSTALGLLKLRRARVKKSVPGDYLTASGVSMV